MGQRSVADFMFRTGPQHNESQVLIVGARAVVVLTTSRPANDGVIGALTSARATADGSAARERAWWAEQVAAAERQLDDTVRLLHAGPAPQRFTTERGRALDLDPAMLEWTGLLIVDHPAPPAGVDPGPDSGRIPLAVVLRRDWEVLLHELRSAAAVVRYLDWCARRGPVPDEVPAHYAWLAVASELPPRPAESFLRALAAKPLLRDVLPGHAVIGRLLDYVASTQLHDVLDEAGRHRLLSLIDEFPVDARSDLGEWTADPAVARLRTFRFADGIPQYVVAVMPDLNDAWSAAFHDLVQLRHHEAREQAADPASLCTFGFVLAAGANRWPWPVAYFTCLQGPVTLTPSELVRIREFWSGTVS
jgi:hypothetical protein